MLEKKSRPCPVCNSGCQDARLFLKENMDPSRLNEFSYASRKTPEFMCHKLVQCRICDLVYANNPPDHDELADAYHAADYDSAEEANDAAAAYIRAIGPTLSLLTRRQSALEIGTGTGIFLEHLSKVGFTELVGVEPSFAAIAAAPENRKAWIHRGMFQESNFAPASFDLICCFMTMEHVREPSIIAQAAQRLLRPGGAFVIVVHDYRSVVNRLLGKHSPIVDIEHLQLFSRRSARYLLEENDYTDVTVSAFVNAYSLQYWMRLTPLPQYIKQPLLGLLSKINLGQTKLRLNVGNLIAAGHKNV